MEQDLPRANARDAIASDAIVSDAATPDDQAHTVDEVAGRMPGRLKSRRLRRTTDGSPRPARTTLPRRMADIRARRVQSQAMYAASGAPTNLAEWWGLVRRWLAEHVYVAPWLPRPLRQARAVYVAAALLEAMIALILPLLRHAIHSFLFPESSMIFVITCLAIMLGTGPALAATVAGAVTVTVLLQPRFTALAAVAYTDPTSVVFLLALGTLSSFVGGLALEGRLRAQQSAEEMDDFLSIVSHELGNPLTAAKMSTELAMRHGDDQDRNDHLLRQVDEALDRMNLLVTDLLDASRARTGKLAIEPKPMDLTAMTRDVVAQQRMVRPTRTITLADPGASVVVVADARRVEQVLANYLTNALKYSPEDRPVAVALAHADGVATVAVRDGGPGLTVAQRRRIWERGYRAPGVEVQSGTGVGLGLGLYIARSIIERQDGVVGVKSRPGKGSTFWFALPIPGNVSDGDATPGATPPEQSADASPPT